MPFIVLKPGPLTTIQDLGRPGWGAFGVPEGGAMDRQGLRRANLLVGNAPGAPALEFSLSGPTLRWQGKPPVACAVVGDEEATPRVHPMEEVYAGFLTTRAHGYLAVPGGFTAERVLGGRGTCLPGGFGGFQGRALKAGDVLEVTAPSPALSRAAAVLPDPYGDEPGPLRVMRFGDSPALAEAFTRLTSGEWKVETGDRVGVTLSGRRLPVDGLGLSQPTVAGAIQVNGAGRPILLLRDHPTVGGYPVVAVVVQADIDRAGRLRPGQALRFEAVTEAQALDLLRRR
jgi:biotin-dependent carboxylase-like uncharacterized protein